MAHWNVILTVTTDATGDGTATATKSVAGWIEKIVCTDGTLANSHTLSLSATSTPSGVDETLWSTTAGDTNSDTNTNPVVANRDQAYDTLSGQYTRIYAVGKLKLTVAAGGSGGVGGITVYGWDLN